MRAQARFRKNDQTAAVAQATNYPIKVRWIESNASCSRMARAPPSVNEYCRPPVRHRIRPIISDHDEQIVELVGPCKPLMAEFASRPAVQRLVVVFVFGIVAPNLPVSDWNAFYCKVRGVHPIRPEVSLMQVECAGRRAPVAFDFRVPDSAAADRARKSATEKPGAPSSHDDIEARRLHSKWPNFSDLTAR